jgi:hypothetical protein
MKPIRLVPQQHEAAEETPWDVGVLPYQVLCLAGLAVILLVEVQRGLSLVGLLIPLVGLLGMLSQMSLAPVLLLFTMAATWAVRHFYFRQMEFSQRGLLATDALLCGGVLIYVIAHFRLQALTDAVVPRDPRRRLTERDWLGRRLVAPQPRTPRLATRWEVGLLALMLPAWVLLGHLSWFGINRPWNPAEWPIEVSRLILLAWILGVLAMLAAAVLGIWKRRQQSATTAAVALQDVVWHDTRGEQRRITRWLSWARLKARGENP